jgi:hypothetical protein
MGRGDMYHFKYILLHTYQDCSLNFYHIPAATRNAGVNMLLVYKTLTNQLTRVGMMLDTHACLLCGQSLNSVRKFGSYKGVLMYQNLLIINFRAKVNMLLKYILVLKVL